MYKSYFFSYVLLMLPNINIMSSRKGSFSFFWLACPAKLNAVLCLVISERFVFHVSYTTSLITSHLKLCPGFCVTCFNSFDSSFDFSFSFQQNIVFKIFLQKESALSIQEVIILMAFSLVS